MRPKRLIREVRINDEAMTKEVETPGWAKEYEVVTQKRKPGGRSMRGQRLNLVSDGRNEGTAQISQCSIKEGLWERIQVTVDSGAMRNVIPKNVAQAFEIEESDMTKAGINFVAANDSVIKNYGQRKILGMTEDWSVINFNAHVADVMKPLASVVEMEESNLKVVFGKGASYIQSVRTGQKINLSRDGREYKFDVWVPAQAKTPARGAGVAVKNQFSVLAEDDKTPEGRSGREEPAMDF